MTDEDILFEALIEAGENAYKRGAFRRENPIRTTMVTDPDTGTVLRPQYLRAQMWDKGWQEAMKEAKREREAEADY